MIPTFYFHSIYRDVLGLYINQTFLDNLKNHKIDYVFHILK